MLQWARMDQVTQVREKTDIVSLISQYIPLKQAGKNFKATCPFHQEKTPSFVVSPERQIWHCFGCHKGGDAFSFLMEYEKLEFPEALRQLAKQANIQLIDVQNFDTSQSSKKEGIYQLNHLAAEFYHYLLTKHTIGNKAKGYLINKRHINKKLLETFVIGYAPSQSNALVRFLVDKKKYAPQQLLDAGLASSYAGKLRDFFANRVMFPLIDHRGNIVGFSGRSFGEKASEPKYINTRETLVYHKGSHFFGLSVTKQEIQKNSKQLLLRENLTFLLVFKKG